MKELDSLLASIFVLRQNVHGRHFNVTGTHFRSLHLMYDDIYKMLDKHYDKLGEMIRQENEYPIYNISRMLEISLFESDNIVFGEEEGASTTAYNLDALYKYIDNIITSNKYDQGTNNDLAQMESEIKEQYYFIGSYAGITRPK